MMGWISRAWRLPLALLLLVVGGCAGQQPENRELVLPDADEVAAWFGEGTTASLDGNVLEIRGEIDPEFLRRGGRIWARSGPYFYLFNVHVQQLMVDYPDIAAVRARAFTRSGEELAVATLERSDLNELRWREALARASLAQREGTDNPQIVERLIRFGEDHTDFSYADRAN